MSEGQSILFPYGIRDTPLTLSLLSYVGWINIVQPNIYRTNALGCQTAGNSTYRTINFERKNQNLSVFRVASYELQPQFNLS